MTEAAWLCVTGAPQCRLQGRAVCYEEGTEIAFSECHWKTLPFPKACFTEIIMDVAYTDAHMISLKSLSDSRVYCQLLPKQKGTRGASRFRCRARRLVRFPLSTKQRQPQPLKALSWQAELPPLWPVYPQLSQIKKERGKQKEKCILQSLLKAKE